MVVILSYVSAGGSAVGADLGAGQSAVVDSGSAIEPWVLEDAVLRVDPGGTTFSILLQQTSELTLNGATVATTAGSPGFRTAIELVGSTASITGDRKSVV